jgi:hypothetical protein
MKYIFTVFVATVITFAYVSDPVNTPEPEVKKAIKLSSQHLPISRYFSDDEDDDSTAVNHAVLFRRETSIKARTGISDDNDDYELSDGIKLRLTLARLKALEVYQKIHENA